MEKFWPFFFILLIFNSCGQSNKTATSKSEPLPTHWIEVQKQNGEWVIYEPCDATSFMMALKQDTIIVGWGQTMDMFRITNKKQTPDSSFTISALSSCEEKWTFEMKASANKTHWVIKNSDGITHEKYLIPLADTVYYKHKYEPCEECWGQEICDSLKKHPEMNSDINPIFFR